MRQRVRYATRQSIERRIERYYLKRAVAYSDIIDIERKISSIALTGAPNGEWRIRSMIDTKLRLEAKCEGINRRLKRLKENMGEFLTPQIPALDNGDRSVAA